MIGDLRRRPEVWQHLPTSSTRGCGRRWLSGSRRPGGRRRESWRGSGCPAPYASLRRSRDANCMLSSLSRSDRLSVHNLGCAADLDAPRAAVESHGARPSASCGASVTSAAEGEVSKDADTDPTDPIVMQQDISCRLSIG